MKRLIAIAFAFVYFVLVFGYSKASAVTTESVMIEGVSYPIKAETPYVIVVPEYVEIGKSGTVYIAGAVNGTVVLTAPSSITLVQDGVETNKMVCIVTMGTDNKVTLTKSSTPHVASSDITVNFKEEAPLTGNWSGNFTYSLNETIVKDVTEYLNFTLSSDGTYYIISSVSDPGILDYCNNNLVLPSTYNGKPVRGIGEKAFYAGLGGPMKEVAQQERAIKVTIPKSIESIGRYAFGYFGGTGTEFIIEGENLKVIGESAFNRSYLKSINIPDSVSTIGRRAFSYCTKLTKINIPKSLSVLENWAFENCELAAGEITIPKSLTEMGQNVFDSCKKITTVKWNCELESIPFGTFDSCTALKNFSMSSAAEASLTEIKGYAFYNCKMLTSFEFPDGVSLIADYAFYNSGLLSATYSKAATTYTRSFPTSCVLNPI